MSEHNLLEQFMRLQWLLSRYHHHSHSAHGPMGNPYRGQGRVLKLLKMQPEISQKDLSELLDMRPQSLGELLAKLERNGYITRIPSESDKRVMMIRLNDKGAAASNQDEEQPVHDNLFNCLSDEEQINLSVYLNRITDVLEEQSADGKDWPEHKRHDKHEHEHGHGKGHGFGHHGRGGSFDGHK